MLFLTTFSTMVSGYTAVGIPNEAASIGFLSFRWLGIFVNILMGFVLFAPRIRRLSIARSYQSPNDILAGRYNCNSLRLFGALSICAPQVTYTAAQFLSLSGLLKVVMPDVDADAGAWFLVLFIYMCEVIGGFRSASLTGAVQSSIMCFAFIMMPFILLSHFSGYTGINGPTCSNNVWVNATTLTADTLKSRPFTNDAGDVCLSGSINCVNPQWNFGPPAGKTDAVTSWPAMMQKTPSELAGIDTHKGL